MKFPTHATFFLWQPATWLRVSGDDAANFLQGQFTNDLKNLARGSASYGLWLNVKGKVVADSFIARGAGEFWVGSYFSPAGVIRERLEGFVIADDVIVEDQTNAWAGVTLFGAGVPDSLATVPGDEFVFFGRRERGESIEWVFPATRLTEVRARLAGLREVNAREVARRRLAAGIPAVPADIGLGDLPNEGGLEAAAISYTKGCYLGQEVMARLKSMGQLRRRLLRVASTKAGEKIPPLPAELFRGERKVGELRSAVSGETGGFTGLAMLSLIHLTPDALLSFSAGGGAGVRLLEVP